MNAATIARMPSIDLGPYTSTEGYQRALALDAEDSLSEFRSHYVHPDPDLIYLDGNSLGRMPIDAPSLVNEVVESQWSDRLIRSWNEGWWELQLRLGDLIAPLVGAGEGEVIVSDSTSVNLYKLAHAAVTARPGRAKIVTDDLNFPTDIYVLEGIAKQLDVELVIVESDGLVGPLESLTKAIDRDTALVTLSHTVFKSGYTYDLVQVGEMAHDVGALVLWDLSHSVGAVPIDLQASNADLAVGCTYKYLNGGPGAPAFLYVRKPLQETLSNPITAWWGHAEPFEFDLSFKPIKGIRQFHTGTMPILSLAAAESGVSDVRKAGMSRIRAKSELLSGFFIEQYEEHLEPLGFGLASPRSVGLRGSHISLSHVSGWPINRALIEVGQVIPDFRMPDNLRFGLSPLYNSFLDVHTAIQRLRAIVESDIHSAYTEATATVT